MTAKTRLHRGMRMAGAFALLAAICACGGSDDEDAPPPPPSNSTAVPVTTPAPTAMPAPAAGGAVAQFDIGPGFMPDPRTSTGTAGGPTPASTLNSACLGYIAAAPNHTLNLSAAFTNLRLVVNSPRDTTLVVQLADGSYRCDDDGGEGMNPLVSGPFPAGLHRVFIGSYTAGAASTYTLGVTELMTVSAATLGGAASSPTGGPTAMPPPPAAGGTSSVSLTPNFMPDPHTATGMAGGPLNAATLDSNCVGSVPTSPQHTMMLASDFRLLKVMVNSTADTTLVIRGPDGRYRCNDDGGGGSRPMVSGAWGPGTYQIWVGVYGGGAPQRYTIGFSELASVTAAGLPL